jgi:hypothetical protein
MKIELTHPQTKQTFQVEVAEVDLPRLAEMLAPRQSPHTLQQRLDNLPYNRDTKALLGELGRLSLTIGGVVLQVGRKLLEMVFALVQRFPNTAFYTLIGFALGSIISSIPILGWLLGWLVLPLLTALGLAMGVWNDFQVQQQQRQLAAMIETVRLESQASSRDQEEG